MNERQQELERRLQDVTGQLGSGKKSAKKGKLVFNSSTGSSFIISFLNPSDENKANAQAPNRQSSSSSSSDSSSSSSSDSSSSDSSDSEAGQTINVLTVSQNYLFLIKALKSQKKSRNIFIRTPFLNSFSQIKIFNYIYILNYISDRSSSSKFLLNFSLKFISFVMGVYRNIECTLIRMHKSSYIIFRYACHCRVPDSGVNVRCNEYIHVCNSIITLMFYLFLLYFQPPNYEFVEIYEQIEISSIDEEFPLANQD